MAAEPLMTDAIALTEKKMDMTLDEIIKMSKNKTTKPKKQQRISNKRQKPLNTASQDKSVKLRGYMDSRSSLRQAAFGQRRSNFQRNQFPMAAEHARKAAVAPIRNRPFNRSRGMNVNTPRVGAPPVQKRAAQGGFVMKRAQQQGKVTPMQKPQTLDLLFANMKEQRMRQQQTNNNAGGRRFNGGGAQQRQQQWGRGRFGNY